MAANRNTTAAATPQTIHVTRLVLSGEALTVMESLFRVCGVHCLPSQKRLSLGSTGSGNQPGGLDTTYVYQTAGVVTHVSLPTARTRMDNKACLYYGAFVGVRGFAWRRREPRGTCPFRLTRRVELTRLWCSVIPGTDLRSVGWTIDSRRSNSRELDRPIGLREAYT